MAFWRTCFELPGDGHRRWLAMEGLRGMAVVLVFFVHYTELVSRYFGAPLATFPWIDAVNEVGNAGVDVFFVLSGFLIYRTCIGPRNSWWDYAVRRVERIYPAFLATFAVYMCTFAALPTYRKLPDDSFAMLQTVLANLLLLPGVLPMEPIITVAWSLSYEALFYVVVPLVVIGLGLRRWHVGARIALFVTLGIAMSAAAAVGYDRLYRYIMFLGGMTLQELANLKHAPSTEVQSRTWHDVVVLIAFVASLCAFTILGRSRDLLAGTSLTQVPAYLKFVLLNVTTTLLVYRCLFGNGLAQRMFSISPLRWLGNMSYSYYLFHGFALQVFFKLTETALDRLQVGIWHFWVWLLPAFVASALLSLPLYLGVERPWSLLNDLRGQSYRVRLQTSLGFKARVGAADKGVARG